MFYYEKITTKLTFKLIFKIYSKGNIRPCTYKYIILVVFFVFILKIYYLALLNLIFF